MENEILKWLLGDFVKEVMECLSVVLGPQWVTCKDEKANSE